MYATIQIPISIFRDLGDSFPLYQLLQNKKQVQFYATWRFPKHVLFELAECPISFLRPRTCQCRFYTVLKSSIAILLDIETSNFDFHSTLQISIPSGATMLLVNSSGAKMLLMMSSNARKSNQSRNSSILMNKKKIYIYIYISKFLFFIFIGLIWLSP